MLFNFALAAFITTAVLGFRIVALDHDVTWWQWPFVFACAIGGAYLGKFMGRRARVR
jgi:hypothetical protein